MYDTIHVGLPQVSKRSDLQVNWCQFYSIYSTASMPKKSKNAQENVENETKAAKKSEKKVSKKLAKLALELSDDEMDTPNEDKMLKSGQSGKLSFLPSQCIVVDKICWITLIGYSERFGQTQSY